MTLQIRRTKEKLAMGKRKDPNAPRRAMRKVSPKQRKRTDGLQEKLKIILAKQEELYGEKWCEAGAGIWADRCPRNKGRSYKLFADHVNTRNETNPDRFENLQVLCGWCNAFLKGSRRIDFRPPEMIAAMKELDTKAGMV